MQDQLLWSFVLSYALGKFLTPPGLDSKLSRSRIYAGCRCTTIQWRLMYPWWSTCCVSTHSLHPWAAQWARGVYRTLARSCWVDNSRPPTTRVTADNNDALQSCSNPIAPSQVRVQYLMSPELQARAADATCRNMCYAQAKALHD